MAIAGFIGMKGKLHFQWPRAVGMIPSIAPRAGCRKTLGLDISSFSMIPVQDLGLTKVMEQCLPWESAFCSGGIETYC